MPPSPDLTPGLAQPALSIAPFEFAPEGFALEGRAFSTTFQALAWLMVAGLGGWLFVLWQQGKFGDPEGWDSLRRAGWFILGWVLLAWTALQVRQSRTRIDGQGLFQSWIWNKHMPFEQLAYSQMIRIKGLEWLIAWKRFAVSEPCHFREKKPHWSARFSRFQSTSGSEFLSLHEIVIFGFRKTEPQVLICTELGVVRINLFPAFIG